MKGELLLSRADASTLINGTAGGANGKWNANQVLKTGAWKLEYRVGTKVCSTKTLQEVKCWPGFKDSGGDCIAVAVPAANIESNVVQLIVGGLVGALFAAGLLSLFQYARQDPERFKKLIASFLMNEVNVLNSTITP